LHTVGLFEAKQKLSEIVERAAEGERIGITRRGRLAAIVIPAQSDVDLAEVFDNIERLRGKVRRQRKVHVKDLIEEGRV
jgi:prevent-host-death family protein